MTTTLHTHFYGVFSPKGELEAVEETYGQAEFVAANLSPTQDGRKVLNREIDRVLIIRGGFDKAVNTLRNGVLRGTQL